MIIYWQNHIGGKVGAHKMLATGFNRLPQHITAPVAAPGGRIMSSLVNHGGLVGSGGIAGQGGGLVG